MRAVETEEEQRAATPGEPGRARSGVLAHPSEWPPAVAAAVVFVVVLAIAVVVVLVVVGAFTSNGTHTTTVAPPQVEPSARLKTVGACLQTEGSAVSTDGLDFVAQTALGGAIKATVQDNVVTVSDGGTLAGARAVTRGYHLLSRDLPLARLLRAHGRFVMLWQHAPTGSQTRTVLRCLR